MPRLDYIDVAKGMCILLVVMGHILQYNCEGNGARMVFDFIYSFHMPVFMLLSGYVVSLSRDRVVKENAMVFIKNKFVSLVIPFLVWGLVVMPFIVRRDSFSCFSAIAKELALQPDTGAWFLISLFCIQVYFLLFCLFANTLKCKTQMNAEAISLAVVLGVLLLGHKTLNVCCPNLRGGVSFYMPERYVFFFFLGYSFNRYLVRQLYKKWIMLVSALVFVALVRYYTFGNDPYKLQMLCGIFASIIVLHIARAIDQLKSLETCKEKLVLYGKNSLVIYLTHFPIIMLLRNEVRLDTDAIAGIPLFIIVAVVSVPVCAICTFWGRLVSENSLFDKLLYGRNNKNVN